MFDCSRIQSLVFFILPTFILLAVAFSLIACWPHSPSSFNHSIELQTYFSTWMTHRQFRFNLFKIKPFSSPTALYFPQTDFLYQFMSACSASCTCLKLQSNLSLLTFYYMAASANLFPTFEIYSNCVQFLLTILSTLVYHLSPGMLQQPSDWYLAVALPIYSIHLVKQHNSLHIWLKI